MFSPDFPSGFSRRLIERRAAGHRDNFNSSTRCSVENLRYSQIINLKSEAQRAFVDGLLITDRGRRPGVNSSLKMDASSKTSEEAEDISKGKASAADQRRQRKRTRRACDKCNVSRTRCNGDHPW